MVEPELPQSRGWSGAVKVAGGSDDFDCVVRCGVTWAPRAATQAREEAQSAPVEKLERRVVPSASPPSNA